MRFRRGPRPTAYRETSRKRAAFLRKQRLEREALPLFAAQIDARQHGIDEEMARRATWWVGYERDRRDQSADHWREARVRLFADRKGRVEGKNVAGSVDLGGRRDNKTKNR